ncbi:MAG: fatty acid desaturase [Bacteroidetes bacterium]|nr:fatty acid desaturase [Bacteroidota bacterium]
MDYKDVRFAKDDNFTFVSTVRQRVNEYFTSNNISRFRNSTMIIKTIFMLSLYFIPYFVLLSGLVLNMWMVFGLFILMGLGISGIGLSIMHDANHGAYSKNPNVNKALGYLINLIGGSAINWKIQHNVLHHTFPNVDGVDEDIDPGPMLRLSPHQKRYKIHRFQHFYAWFFYGFMTMSWVLAKDYVQLLRYKKMGIIKSQNRTFRSLFLELTITKVAYYLYVIVLPLLIVPIPWWVLIMGVVVMHFLAGFILACIFQTAHVMPSNKYPLPDDKGNLENNWAIHQLITTTNYAPTNKLLSWFVGGLNYQVEHHLFPNICHVHYKNLATIVKATAEEFNLPYNSIPTYRQALLGHAKLLKSLGRSDVIPD